MHTYCSRYQTHELIASFNSVAVPLRYCVLSSTVWLASCWGLDGWHLADWQWHPGPAKLGKAGGIVARASIAPPAAGTRTDDACTYGMQAGLSTTHYWLTLLLYTPHNGRFGFSYSFR